MSDAKSVFDELKSYIGFDANDAANVRLLGPVVRDRLAVLVERFYEEIVHYPGARERLVDGSEPAERLREALTTWLHSLFGGTYDAAYVQQRVRIGRVHVRLGLKQRYLCAAMEVIRQELTQAVLAAGVPDADARLDSLQKLLALESAIVVESYYGVFAEQVRERERSAMQERLTRAEHLAEIGQLAASLAHEIKNPLAGISGAIQVIRDGMQPDDPHRPILGEVLRQIHRLDRTVKDLLVYARPLPPRFDDCDLRRVVERLKTVLRREPAMQRVDFKYHSKLGLPPTIEADENQIEQLLMNLVLNAAQASEDGGAVILTARPTATGVQLDVEDHGHGMDEETRQRALEPFFTTKARGTGLGLPICRRIVQSHGGTLSLHSIVGKQTIVTVQLPRQQPRLERDER